MKKLKSTIQTLNRRKKNKHWKGLCYTYLNFWSRIVVITYGHTKSKGTANKCHSPSMSLKQFSLIGFMLYTIIDTALRLKT